MIVGFMAGLAVGWFGHKYRFEIAQFCTATLFIVISLTWFIVWQDNDRFLIYGSLALGCFALSEINRLS